MLITLYNCASIKVNNFHCDSIHKGKEYDYILQFFFKHLEPATELSLHFITGNIV